jgi:hypothetical protein
MNYDRFAFRPSVSEPQALQHLDEIHLRMPAPGMLLFLHLWEICSRASY